MRSEDLEVVVSDSPSGNGDKAAVITDRAAGRAWSGEGGSADAATTEAVRRFVDDRRSREYLPKWGAVRS